MASTSTLPASAVHLEERIHRIFDHLYANAPVRTPKGIAYEVGKILHTAMYMESLKPASAAFNFSRQEQRRLESEGDAFCGPVSGDCRRQFAAMNRAWKLYPAREQLELGDFDLAFVCASLSGVLVSDKRRDVFGDALEIFRYQWAKRNGGQFFTDQRVTRLAVALLDFDPVRGDDLVDICAGTGGFLLAGLNAIQTLASRLPMPESEMVDLACRSLKGQEADRDIAEVCNATLAARLGNGRAPLVPQGNSLLPDVFAPSGKQSIKFGTHYCAATNPPFGTKITIKDPGILRDYELAFANRSSDLLVSSRFSPKSPDILFIEQNLRLLKPGIGRLAIVVPYQITSGPQTFWIREWILRNASVLAVVDLPGETFQPHTGTKTCLLVLKRREQPCDSVKVENDPPIFMSIPRWIGHDRRGNPVYRRSPDGSVSDEILSDFEEVETAHRAFKDARNPSDIHDASFIIHPSEIAKDLGLRMNAQFHRPHLRECFVVSSQSPSPRKGWRTVHLGEIVSRVFYPGRFKRHYVEPSTTAVPFLGGTNISQLLITTDKWVDKSTARSQELAVEPGWLLVTRSGSTGIVSSVPAAWKGYAISEHVIRIIPNPNQVPGEYLLAFLRTAYAQEVLAKGVYGSVIDEINPQFICGMEVPIPPAATLNRIVGAIRAGEAARDEAIESLVTGVDCLEKAIS